MKKIMIRGIGLLIVLMFSLSIIVAVVGDAASDAVSVGKETIGGDTLTYSISASAPPLLWRDRAD